MRVSRRLSVLSVLAVLATLATGLAPAAGALPTADDYAALREQRYGPPRPLTAPVEWSRDTASWTLTEGTVRLLRPTTDGDATGLVFVGRGRFTMSVPHAVERRQLARLSGGAEAVDVAFTRLVLRTTEPLVAAFFGAAEGPYDVDPLARDQHEGWLVEGLRDVDARIVAGLRLPAHPYFLAAMDTDVHGWLLYEHDELRREEIQLVRQTPGDRIDEVWVSLDRPSDRGPDGAPAGALRQLADVVHLDLDVDLTGHERPFDMGISGTNGLEAQVTAGVDLVADVGGATALLMSLSALAEVRAVRDEAGRELTVLQDHVGGRTQKLDKAVHDDTFVVLLAEPTTAGAPFRLTFEYQILIANYAPGAAWYPSFEDGFLDRHTARLRFRTHPKQEVRASGRRVEGADGAVEWVVERPAKMVSFTYGRGYREERLEVEELPPIVVFGPQVSRSFGADMIKNVGADVVNSLKFFEWLLEDDLPTEEIQVTGIAAFHGQAFDGFLHLSEVTFAGESHGASQLFRAHETAHQWWGHQVGWHCYRDQWLSESFAEYLSLLYVQMTLKDGDRELEEVMRMYTNLLTGSLLGAFSKYYRPWLAAADPQHLARMGPIGVGWRASTAELPVGYTVQAYYKGPLVLHMLRKLLSYPDRGDAPFLAVLRDFVDTWRDKDPSTADFQRTVEKHAGGDWSWFFDQWIGGTDIPTYVWDYRVPRGPDGDGIWQVEVEIEQRDVSPGFQMPVPIAIQLADGRPATWIAVVDEPKETLTIPLPARPKKLELNPDFAVLARVKRK